MILRTCSTSFIALGMSFGYFAVDFISTFKYNVRVPSLSPCVFGMVSLFSVSGAGSDVKPAFRNQQHPSRRQMLTNWLRHRGKSCNSGLRLMRHNRPLAWPDTGIELARSTPSPKI